MMSLYDASVSWSLGTECCDTPASYGSPTKPLCMVLR